jgi:hypothetical protein
LALFRATQSVQQNNPTQTIDELIQAVHDAYWSFFSEKCENVWITLQLVWDRIIVCDSRNDFKIPHIGKAKLRHQGRLEMEI